MTTTGTRGNEGNDKVIINGKEVDVKPKPLVQKHQSEPKTDKPKDSQSGSKPIDSNKSYEKSGEE
jgi:hypothetical protein